MIATEIEKQNLEAHVEICAVRYASLEAKLNSLETRMDKVESHLVDIKTALLSRQDRPTPQKEDANPYKTMITIGTTIIGALIAGIITLLVQLYSK
jgi:chaperonin cofactor prefoldin